MKGIKRCSQTPAPTCQQSTRLSLGTRRPGGMLNPRARTLSKLFESDPHLSYLLRIAHHPEEPVHCMALMHPGVF